MQLVIDIEMTDRAAARLRDLLREDANNEKNPDVVKAAWALADALDEADRIEITLTCAD